ncbi:MAG: FAD-dependent oxidoreductase [Lentisphaeria bacterium]|nr:FAD-dependent oxidoreductase [Lentisphaeria bacterium]
MRQPTDVSAFPRGHAVWLEAEQMADPGGWLVDAQFIDTMGSPYLMAHGLGEPVRDAVVRLDLPAPGLYRLWARTRDWHPDTHPGRFQVLLDGRPAATTFGCSGLPGWTWEEGGNHALGKTVELRLRDLTGTNARCDALLLTTDVDYVPPGAVPAIETLRRRLGGVGAEAVAMPACDVLVVGGGLAGCTAAVAAARNGARVVLLQNRPVLGGNASPEILVPPVGVWPHRGLDPLNPRETGLLEEYRTEGNQKLSEGKLYAGRLLRWVTSEAAITLHLDTHATGVTMHAGDKTAIAAVEAMEVLTGRRLRFPAAVVLDCSGDSTVAVAAGADFRTGREAKSLHQEPWAPEQPLPYTMGNGIKYFSRDLGSPQPFTPPPWAYRFETCEEFRPKRHPRLDLTPQIDYQWMYELGGQQDTIADAEDIRDELFRLIYGLWDHVKNHCPKLSRAAVNHRLIWVGHVAGKRENRRLLGDVILTQNDILARTLFPDRVAYGAWVVDDHHSAGFFHDGTFGRHQDDPDHAAQGVEFSIPFRCLYSRNVDNLMMAGRNISATHLAMSDTRVMLTCAVMGHAAGTGAALCVRHRCTPRQLLEHHLRELQQHVLKEGAYIPGLRAEDPRDLAPRAVLTASSAAAGPDGKPLSPACAVDGWSRAEGSNPHAWVPDDGAPAPHWLQLAWPRPVAFNVLHITFQTARLAPRNFRLEAWKDRGWTPIAEVDENRHRRLVLGVDRLRTSRLRLVSHTPAAVCSIRVYEEAAEDVETARRAQRTRRLPDVGPFLPWGDE